MTEPVEMPVAMSPEGLKAQVTKFEKASIRKAVIFATQKINAYLSCWVEDRERTKHLLSGYIQLRERNLTSDNCIPIPISGLARVGSVSAMQDCDWTAVKSVIADYRAKGWEVEEFMVPGATLPNLYIFHITE